MRQYIGRSCFLILLGLPFSLFSAGANQALRSAPVSVQVATLGDTSHFEFFGQEQWSYSLRRLGPTTFELLVPPLEAKAADALRLWQDGHIEKIVVEPNGPDGQDRIILTLKNSKIESFDYLTDQPSRLIVDFYPQLEKDKPVPSKLAAGPKASRPKADKKKRQPAGEFPQVVGSVSPPSDASPPAAVVPDYPQRGLYDAADPDYLRFKMRPDQIREEAIIASRQNIYLEFPMLVMPNTRLSELRESPPEFVINPKDGQENKEARLVLTLFSRGKLAATLKTATYFTNKYKNSIYDEIVRHVAAQAHYQLYLKDRQPQYFESYKDLVVGLIEKYPNSVLRERSELVLAYDELENRNYAEATRRFQALLQQGMAEGERDSAKLALADALRGLKLYDQAKEMIASVVKEGSSETAVAEATYRLGDIAFEKKDFTRAVREYSDAIQRFPQYRSRFPSASYNMAEALFWTKDYPKSLDETVEFLRLFPNHWYGGFSCTRVGELLGILGADESRAVGAFLETVFRFRTHPGAEVAQLRLLSQRMKGLKDRELKLATNEMRQIAKKSALPKMEEFTTLLIADGLDRRGAHEDVVTLLANYYQQNPLTSDPDYFRRRISTSISHVLKNDTEAGDFTKALLYVSRHAHTWLQKSDRLDIDYYVARAYEQAGATTEAIGRYKALLDRRSKMSGTTEEKERRVIEHLPEIPTLRLRLAAAQYEEREYLEALKDLQLIPETALLTPEEKVERIEVAAAIAEKRGQAEDAATALEQLKSQWKDDPTALVPVYLRLSRLRMTSGKLREAYENITQCLALMAGKENLIQKFERPALQLKGEIQERQGEKIAAVATYLGLLGKYERQAPLSSLRYRAGEILLNAGDQPGAKTVWEGLQATSDGVYRRLADERLSNAKWEEDYKKYLNRIPAAQTLK